MPAITLRRCLPLAVAAAGLVVHAQSGQVSPPQATFRAAVDLVDVDVSVLDRHRLPVTGLTAEDFTVYENGRPRPIATFSPVDLPMRERPQARWMETSAPDVVTNVVRAEGRLVTILMNRAITAAEVPVAQQIAMAAVDQLGPGDLAAVIYATHGVPQNFTADRRILREAIERPFAVRPEGDGGGGGECYCGSCSLETIAHVAESLHDVRHRRRILIVIGTNITIRPTGACSGTIDPLRERATRALEAANVTVYTFDPSGVQTLAQQASTRVPMSPQQVVQASIARRGNLLYLPDHTGGRAVVGVNDPAVRVAEVFRESRAYYAIGFAPAVPARTGFQRIEVKVRRPGIVVQARAGYFSGALDRRDKEKTGAPDVPPVLGAAIKGLWPRTDLALEMSAVPWSLPGMLSATVSVQVGVHGVLPERAAVGASSSDAGATARPPVTMVVGAYDRNGHSMASVRQTLTDVPAPRDGRVDYEVLSFLSLKPGRYELRAAVEDGAISATGSVYGYIEVPAFHAEKISLSGIVLEATPAPLPVLSAGPPLGSVLPFVPTTRREFRVTDRVMAFVREHQGAVRALMPGYATARIVDEDDQIVHSSEQRLLPEMFGADRATNVSVEVPIARLGPGEYLLTIEVRHGNDRGSRDVWFRIR